MKLLLVVLLRPSCPSASTTPSLCPSPAADHTGSKIVLVNAHRVKSTRHRTAPLGSPALHARRGGMKMPNWVRKLRRRRRYIIPGLIWFAAVALFIAV